MTPPPLPLKDGLVSNFDGASSWDQKTRQNDRADELVSKLEGLSLNNRADFVGRFKHGPAHSDGEHARRTPPTFPTPTFQVPPLPRPPQMLFPTPVHYQPSRTMQYALSDDANDPVWLELDPPELPQRPHSDGLFTSKKESASENKLAIRTPPELARSISSPPITPTASKTSGTIGDDRTRCCGITKKGERCIRQVKAGPPLNTVDPDLDIERFCFQHEKELNKQTGFYSRSSKDWIDFSDYIPDYLHADTQTALRIEMERPPAESDEPGFIYAFEIRSPDTPFLIHLKVGRTVKLGARLNDWQKQCGSKEQILRGWWPGTIANKDLKTSLMKGCVQEGMKGALCHKLERLVHLELADLVVHTPYLHDDFPSIRSADSSDSAKMPRSNPGTPNKAGKRTGASSPALISLQQGNKPCPDCGTMHKEIFPFIRPETGPFKGREWDKLVLPVIEKWGRFAETLV